MPGHGSSPGKPLGKSGAHIDQPADVLEAVINTLQARGRSAGGGGGGGGSGQSAASTSSHQSQQQEQVVLCGKGWGGGAAIRFAVRHPKMVKAMVLMIPDAVGDLELIKHWKMPKTLLFCPFETRGYRGAAKAGFFEAFLHKSEGGSNNPGRRGIFWPEGRRLRNGTAYDFHSKRK
eukprot:SAG22_NODE_401_length_11080_cov_18.258082_2_plen_176_part_00